MVRDMLKCVVGHVETAPGWFQQEGCSTFGIASFHLGSFNILCSHIVLVSNVSLLLYHLTRKSCNNYHPSFLLLKTHETNMKMAENWSRLNAFYSTNSHFIGKYYCILVCQK